MSTVSLKNHLNHADGSRTNKINANTVLCPLFIQHILADAQIALVELNFKAADKLTVIFNIPTDLLDVQDKFHGAVDQYNTAIATQSLKTAAPDIFTHDVIVKEQIDISDAVIVGLLNAKVNKGNPKNGVYQAEIQFKKAEAAPRGVAPEKVAAKQKEKQQTQQQQSPEQPTPSSQQQKSTTQPSAQQPALKRKNQHKEHADLIANRVVANLCAPTIDPIDFTAIAQAHTLSLQLSSLQHTLSLAKNKEKAALQVQIDAIEAQLAPIQGQYAALKDSIAKSILQDVVTVSNIGYTQGYNSHIKK